MDHRELFYCLYSPSTPSSKNLHSSRVLQKRGLRRWTGWERKREKERFSWYFLMNDRDEFHRYSPSKWRLESGRRRMNGKREEKRNGTKESPATRIPHSFDTCRNGPTFSWPCSRIPHCHNPRRRWIPVNCWPFSQISSLISILCMLLLSGIRNFLEKSYLPILVSPKFPCTSIHDLLLHVMANLSILGMVYYLLYWFSKSI